MEQSSNNFSLLGLMEQAKTYFQILLKRWWLIGAISLVFGLWFYIQAKKSGINYIATHSFMVKEDEGSGSLFSNILGQFGLKSGGPKGDYNLDKLIEITKSKKIIRQTLFTSCRVNEKEDLLINHLLEHYGDFDDDDAIQRLTLKKEYSRDENQIVANIYDLIVGVPGEEGKLNISYSSESGIIYMTMATSNEELSRMFTKYLYHHLGKFYIIQANEKQTITLEKLEDKRDSLHQVLVAKEFELARMNDQGFGIILQKDKVQKSRLTSEIFLTNTMYSELIKNVENAAFNLKNATPVFQTIDEPQYPLRIMAKSTIKAAFTGCVIGALLMIGLIIGRKIFLDKLEQEQQAN
jgi:hypothetical protein